MYGILLMLSARQKCTFNPAITFMFAFRDQISWASVAIFSQFIGAFLASLLGYLTFKNEYIFQQFNYYRIINIGYLDATVSSSLFGETFGEVLGAAILTAGIIF
jgi:glycerol uptake facilitator-like aquaporin